MHTLFGFTESQISWFGVTFGLGALMVYMLFIIGNLAWTSKAGKFGTFILFLVLALCIAGFVAKIVIEVVVEHHIKEKREEKEHHGGSEHSHHHR